MVPRSLLPQGLLHAILSGWNAFPFSPDFIHSPLILYISSYMSLLLEDFFQFPPEAESFHTPHFIYSYSSCTSLESPSEFVRICLFI